MASLPFDRLSADLGKVGGSDGDTTLKPGSRMEYDLFAWIDQGLPAWVRSAVREHHALGPNGSDDSELVSVAYSDGFGRILQTRAQAAELTFGSTAFGDAGLPASQAATNADAIGTFNSSTSVPNVIVSGRQTYDNTSTGSVQARAGWSRAGSLIMILAGTIRRRLARKPGRKRCSSTMRAAAPGAAWRQTGRRPV